MTTKWEVEWVDREGYGHHTYFNDEKEVRSFVEAIKDLCCMLDVYRWNETERERNPKWNN